MNVIITGATSQIAIETARILAQPGTRFLLAGRNPERLNILCADLKARGADAAHSLVVDFISESFDGKLGGVIENDWSGRVDALIAVQGVLGDQGEFESTPHKAYELYRVNVGSVVEAALEVVPYMEKRGEGAVIGVSSVAGDRGRASNYVYGSSKAALNSFFQGLRQRSYGKGVRVTVIKPGFVDTPMTAHLPKNSLYSSPDVVARDIVRAMRSRRRFTRYSPWFWWGIMKIIRSIPERIFVRMKL